MSEDFELQPLQTICEGALVTIRQRDKSKQGIVLGKISARNHTSYAVVLLKNGRLIRLSKGEPIGFLENIMIQELLSHDSELVRDWFAGLARGDYTREHLAAWFLEVQEEQRQEESMISREDLTAVQKMAAQSINQKMQSQFKNNVKGFATNSAAEKATTRQQYLEQARKHLYKMSLTIPKQNNPLIDLDTP